METLEKVDMAESSGIQAVLIFERQVLVFPLLVVLLTCVSFLFGGSCAAWQWWTAVGVVISVPFLCRGSFKAAFGALGLFAFLLFALKCLLPPVVWDRTGAQDMSSYHLPMIQLLIEGWNPVKAPLVDGITERLGLDLWGMSPILVSYYSKTMAVFAAESYRFIGDPTALSFPGLTFLWLGVFLQAARLFKGLVRWTAWSALVFILPSVAQRMPVDLEVAFAACGLLFSMQDALRQKKCDWLALTIWGAWMMNLKHNAVLGAFVFCALFTMAKCWQERPRWKSWLGRASMFGVGLVSLWIVISWSPLVTSWKTYGHPLYPFKTVDEERFPVKDPTWELQGNEDARALGKMGSLAHAYLAPQWTITFYRWKSGNETFAPEHIWWNWCEFPDWNTRLAIWVLFAGLLLFSRGRLWGAGGLLLLGLVPTDIIGFTRYQPWLSALGCLLAVFAAEWAAGKLCRRAVTGLSVAIAFGLAAMGLIWICHHARNVEFKAREFALKRDRIRPKLWINGPPAEEYTQALRSANFTPRYNYLTCFSNRSRLLARQMWGEGETKVLSPAGMTRHQGLDIEWDERNWPGGGGSGENGKMTCGELVPWKDYNVWDGAFDDSDVEAWMMTPFGYWVPVDEQAKHVIEYYTAGGRLNGETRMGQLWRKMKFAACAWGKTYPKEVCKWLIGGYRGPMRGQATFATGK